MNHEQGIDQQPPKYASPRDEALHIMCRDGWANASSGHVESPTGYFSRVSNSVDEMAEIMSAFEEFDYDHINVVGNFFVVENAQGAVAVSEFETAEDLHAVYEALEQLYQRWVEAQQL